MNLISGAEATQEQIIAALGMMQGAICHTLSAGDLPLQRTIAACDKLSQRLNEDNCLPALLALGLSRQKALAELAQAKAMLSREYIEARLICEFGEIPGTVNEFVPYGQTDSVTQAWKPLGVLLHIAAGNVDALPLLSVVEGLLTGNINLLKLPSADDGLTVPLLQELIAIEPVIADYVYVFDLPSSDMESMKKLALMANAVIVWGGDAAITAIRQAAHPDTKIIEWGHKISFAYVSGDVSDESLQGVAYNICNTDQLYCSACQGIYLDTDDMEEVHRFAECFLPILDKTAAETERTISPSLQAQKTLELYTEELESVSAKKRVFRTPRCSVISYPDNRLEPSYMYRNCWVKPLPHTQIIRTLLPYKNRLQTIALVCDKDMRDRLEDTLLKTGIVRITSALSMSEGYCGLPHDGEYPLHRYMKRVSIDRQ